MGNGSLKSPTGCLETKQIEEQDTRYLQTSNMHYHGPRGNVSIPTSLLHGSIQKQDNGKRKEGREKKKENSAT